MNNEKIKAVIDSLPAEQKVIGLKQVLRFASEDRLEAIYLASDADNHIEEALIRTASQYAVPIKRAFPKRTLGKICGIDVGAACVGILKEEAKI